MPDNTFDIKDGSNQILPNALKANQYFIGDSAIKSVSQASQPAPAVPQSSGNESQGSAIIRHYVTHDAIGVGELIRQARYYIVLHAAYYPKYGFDNLDDSISKAMAKEENSNLRLTAIFTDVNAPWVDEFSVTLRDYFAEKGEFAKRLNITKDYFIRLYNKYGAKRVQIYDTAQLPFFPVILIDDTLIVGHYAHSSVIPPDGLWFTIKHPKILSMYECLRAGGDPECNTPEERAIFRYLEELIRL